MTEGQQPSGPDLAPVAVPSDAPLLDQLLGLTGRDPQWPTEQRAGA